MSLNEVLQELPAMTLEQRQSVIRCALELDDLPFSSSDENLIDQRLAAHHAHPDSSLPVDEVAARLRNRFPQ